MPSPKRHHWWPQLQSGHWCGPDQKIHVVARRGQIFKSTPVNIGVEGQLYTRPTTDGPDTEIERWLSEEIEGPFDRVFSEIFDFSRIRRIPFQGDRRKADTAREVGFVIDGYYKWLALSSDHRRVLARYAAALLVRNPRYILRMEEFHTRENGIASPRTAALDNMLYVFGIYEQAIFDATLSVVLRAGSSEFLFSDAGIVANEPWSKKSIPFDIHLPLTPDFALEAFPLPGMENPRELLVSHANNQGVARLNRIVVGHAQRFVFSRSSPPLAFIEKNFGIPGPCAHGHRIVDGKLEVTYDRSRDR